MVIHKFRDVGGNNENKVGPINRIRCSGRNSALGLILCSHEVEPSLSAFSVERGAMGCG